jgi:hypothetical protein
MGFLNGRISFIRYRVLGDSPLPFGEETLEAVDRFAIGKQAPDPNDGVSAGWSAGDHVLDTTFGLEKNVIEDALHVAIRLDSDKVPAELMRAFEQIELAARAGQNPSSRPSKVQRVDAKEAARMRAELEGADGRFRKRKHFPILWDGRESVLYAGTSSAAVLDRLLPLFNSTFGRALEPITAGRVAAGALKGERSVLPTSFQGDEDALDALAWSVDPASPDHLGNEFLVWLWHALKNQGEAILLADGSEAAVMLAKTLTLDCPRGQMGRDSLSDEGPTRLPEAFKALQSGKLPRKAGLVINRHGERYELTLQAETLAVSGLAVPKAEGMIGRDRLTTRIESLRHFAETLDLLYQTFGARRTGPEWSSDLSRIRAWLRAA